MYGQKFYEQLLDTMMSVAQEKNYPFISGAALGEAMTDDDMKTRIAYAITDMVVQEVLKKKELNEEVAHAAHDKEQARVDEMIELEIDRDIAIKNGLENY